MLPLHRGHTFDLGLTGLFVGDDVVQKALVLPHNPRWPQAIPQAECRVERCFVGFLRRFSKHERLHEGHVRHLEIYAQTFTHAKCLVLIRMVRAYSNKMLESKIQTTHRIIMLGPL